MRRRSRSAASASSARDADRRSVNDASGSRALPDPRAHAACVRGRLGTGRARPHGVVTHAHDLRSLAVGWALMLTAMMVPLLVAPVRHVRDRSFAWRRARAIALFVAGYGAMWMTAGALLLSLALAVGSIGYESSLVAALMAGVALVWQCSPAKQRCLNRGRAHPALAAAGRAADIDVLRFGVTHGCWCIGSCWALMMLSSSFRARTSSRWRLCRCGSWQNGWTARRRPAGACAYRPGRHAWQSPLLTRRRRES